MFAFTMIRPVMAAARAKLHRLHWLGSPPEKYRNNTSFGNDDGCMFHGAKSK